MIVVLIVLNTLEIVLFVAAMVAVGRKWRQQHTENVELLVLIESNARKARHGLKNLTDALRIRNAIDDEGEL